MKKIITSALMATSKASGAIAHFLSFIWSWQGIVKSLELRTMQRLLHRFTLPIFLGHKAWYSITAAVSIA